MQQNKIVQLDIFLFCRIQRRDSIKVFVYCQCIYHFLFAQSTGSNTSTGSKLALLTSKYISV